MGSEYLVSSIQEKVLIYSFLCVIFVILIVRRLCIDLYDILYSDVDVHKIVTNWLAD